MGKQMKQPQNGAQEHKEGLPKQVSVRRQSRRRRRKAKKKQPECEDFEEYFQSKKCEICSQMHKEEQLILCDRCDDSFHLSCLQPPLQQLPEDEWVCPACLAQIEQLQFEKSSRKVPQKETHCYACKETLGRREVVLARDQLGNNVEIQCDSLVDLNCLYCRHSFHNFCFSPRKNSLNCQNCEYFIRSQGPKSHDEFMKYIEKSIESVTSSDFSIIQHCEDDLIQKTYGHLRLKIPNYMTSWQFIVQYQSSLYYSFTTKGLTFIDQQIYRRSEKELMRLNNPLKDTQGEIMRLHPKDERVYELFKVNSKKGLVGPFQIKEDRVKGFYLAATDYIEPFTILFEYAGEVMTSRDALNELENDSIFLLLRGPRAVESLDIVPKNYGNSSRFVAGLNNSVKRAVRTKLENIKSLRLSYKGRVRLLLHTIKPIQAGETLYFDYNGSPFQEYPTDHFVP